MDKTMCISAGKRLQELLESVPGNHSHRRIMQQEVECGSGLSGICYRLCSNEPYRMSRTRPKGVCGVDRDIIAARDFLRSVAIGSGCYIHVTKQATRKLKSTALAGRKLKEVNALHHLCDGLRIGEADDSQMALCLSEAVLKDLHRSYEEPMYLTEKLIYAKRTGVWKNTGLLPGDAKGEIFNAIVRTSINLNSDPIDVLTRCPRLGISIGIYGLILVDHLNNILMREPKLGFDPVGMRVIDPEYINVMAAGHQYSMFDSLAGVMEHPKIKEMTDRVGARGIQTAGCTCVEQDFRARNRRYERMLCGHASNNYSSEAVLLTGCINPVVSEFDCSLPGIEPIYEKLPIPILCPDGVTKEKGARHLPYRPEDHEDVSVNVITVAITPYIRHDKVGKRQNPMQGHGCNKAITGVTGGIPEGTLGRSFTLLADLIAAGSIKEVAAVVGCSSPRTKGHDVFIVELVGKPAARDMLMMSAGYTCGGLENYGLVNRNAARLMGSGLLQAYHNLGIPPMLNLGPCFTVDRTEAAAGELVEALGVGLFKPLVAASASQWLGGQALADGAFVLALGFHLRLGLAPFVIGSPITSGALYNQMGRITGGKLTVGIEIDVTAEKITTIISDKGGGLGLNE